MTGAGVVAGGAAAPKAAPPARAAATVRRAPRHKPSSGNPLNALGRHIPFPLPVPDWSKPIIVLLLVLAIAFAVRSQLAATRARRLERERVALLRDLRVMQATLVPPIPERVGALSVSVAYRPADGPAAGGDFYDVLALSPHSVAIVLGDVVGHGRDALDRAALTRYTLRAYLQAGLEPRAALALADSVLTEPGEMRFATVVVGVHDGAVGTLTYACAGHPPPISIGFATPEPLTICCSAPLCCDLPTGRRQTTISLPANGRVCFFSDGLPEARVDDDLLGRERLVELAADPSAPLTATALLERVRDVAQAAPDDMVACIVSPAAGTTAIGGAGGPPTDDSIEELEVDERELHDASRVARFLAACGIDQDGATSLLAQANKLVDAHGAALLRIERSIAGDAKGDVRPGVAVPPWAAVVGGAHASPEATLALPTER